MFIRFSLFSIIIGSIFFLFTFFISSQATWTATRWQTGYSQLVDLATDGTYVYASDAAAGKISKLDSNLQEIQIFTYGSLFDFVPQSIAVNTSGYIWVGSVGAAASVVSFSASGTVVSTCSPIGNYTFSNGSVISYTYIPSSVALDTFSQTLIIGDRGASPNRFARFSLNCQFVSEIPNPLFIREVNAIAADSNQNFWVAETFNRLIKYNASDVPSLVINLTGSVGYYAVRLDTDGAVVYATIVSSFGVSILGYDTATGNQVSNVTFTPPGQHDLYLGLVIQSESFLMADMTNHRVIRVDRSTSAATAYPSNYLGAPLPQGFVAITIYDDYYFLDGENFFAASSNKSIFLRLTPAAPNVELYATAVDATYLYISSNDLANPGPPAITRILLSDRNDDSYVFTSASSPEIPYLGVAVSPDGSVYASEFTTNRVLHWAANRTLINYYNSTSTPAITMNGPYGLSVDSMGRLYIADSGNNRVLRINSDDSLTTFTLGSPVYTVAVDHAFNLYAGTTDGTVLKFNSDASTIMENYTINAAVVGVIMSIAINNAGDVLTVHTNAGFMFQLSSSSGDASSSSSTGEGQLGERSSSSGPSSAISHHPSIVYLLVMLLISVYMLLS